MHIPTTFQSCMLMETEKQWKMLSKDMATVAEYF